MLKENRHTTLMGLQVREETAKKSKRFTHQKPEKIDPNSIAGIRQSTNGENTCLIAATNSWALFNKNIDYSGKDDPQQMVEFMAEIMAVPEEQRAGRAKQHAELYVANQIKSKMGAVHSRYNQSTAKNREKVSDWAKYYSRCSRWEAFFLFVWEGLQNVPTLTIAQRSGSDFMKLPSFEQLRVSFVNSLDDMGAIVSGIGSEVFDVERNFAGMHKPVRAALPPIPRSARRRPPKNAYVTRWPRPSSPRSARRKAGPRWASGSTSGDAPPYNNYFVEVVGTRKYCYNFSH
jgi:hypothetical protein